MAGLRFLVVDDEPAVANVLGKFLGRWGEVDVVYDAETAQAHWEAALAEPHPFDLVTVDLMMPGTGGHVLAKNIRTIEEERHGGRKVKIVVVSGVKRDSQTLGRILPFLDGHLGKPFSANSLGRVLENLGMIEPMEQAGAPSADTPEPGS